MSTTDRSQYVDSHCHLNFNDFDLDRSQVIENASHNGVVRIVVPAVDLDTSQTAIQLTENHPGIFAAVGVHPNSGLSWTQESITNLKNIANSPKVVAFGEIGLDYYRNFCPWEVQKSVLDLQLELAAEMGLPVIIHFRQSDEDITRTLVDWHNTRLKTGSPLADRPGVLHSFSGDLSMAEEMTSKHFKLGIGGPITYPNSAKLQSIVKLLPLESFLLETDAPYLSPQPVRGKRNEPTNVRIVAEKIAELKEIPVQQVAEVTTHEADLLFGWGGSH